jgi:hypothetical protein
VTDKCHLGSRYKINEQTYNELLKQLNSLRSAIERFSFGDRYRESKGVKPIFKNIINTLHRRLSTVVVTTEDRITVAEPHHENPREILKERLKAMLEEGKITTEEYHIRVKGLKNK